MNTRRRAWALTDAVLGISILVVLTGIVGVEITGRAKAAQHLANTRVATDEAELALSQMQQGRAPQNGASDPILVERLKGGTENRNWQWVRVTARHGDRSAILIGLVKANATGGR